MIRHRLPLAAILCLVASVATAQTTSFNGVEVPGVVIAHSPKSSGVFYASPTLAILPDGAYVAAHDASKLRQTMVYRSDDRGRSWRRVATLDGQGFSNLFVHRGALYLMGTTGGTGGLTIRRSTDGGATWTTPADARTGLLRARTDDVAFHTSSVPVVVAGGRIWRGYEAKPKSDQKDDFRAGVLSAAEDADLLDAASWTSTNTLRSDQGWLPNKAFRSWREACVVPTRDGGVAAMIRVDAPRGGDEHAAILHVKDAQTISFDPQADLIGFNGGTKKFTIRYHALTDRYYAIVSLITDENRDPKILPSSHRNIAAIVESTDLRTWTVKRVVLKDLTDMANIGFQYWDWQFDSDDVVAVSRTAFPDGLGGAERFHDANFFTFHRFAGVLAAK